MFGTLQTYANALQKERVGSRCGRNEDYARWCRSEYRVRAHDG